MLAPGSRGTGLKKQPADPRDLKLSAVIRQLGTAAVPTSFDLTRHVHNVPDQGSTGRCQTFAQISGLSIQRDIQGLPYIDPCYDWTYRFARLLDSVVAGEGAILHGDSGATNRSAAMSLLRDGLCQVTHHRKDGLYDGWPNAKETMDLDPLAWWQQQKYQNPPHLIDGLWRCDFDPQIGAHHHQDVTSRVVDNNVPAVRGSIASGHAVVLGIPAKASLYTVPPTGLMSIPQESEQSYGYHSIVLVGYDDNMISGGYTGYFHILNSWGPGFGQGGYGWMPYDWFTKAAPQDRPFDLWTHHWAK